MEIRCIGGMLDGKTVKAEGEPEQTVYQHGLWLVRIHQPFPKRKGEKIMERLMTYTDTYALATIEGELVYHCAHPVKGLYVGEKMLTPAEGGGYDIWLDREGKMLPSSPWGA